MKNMLKWFYKVMKRGKTMIKIDYDGIIDHLNKTWKNNACPMCGAIEWGTERIIYSPLRVGEDNVVYWKDGLMPLVPIVCGKCGNTLFINANIVGCYEDTNIVEGE